MQRKGERQTMTGKEYCRYIRTYSELEGLQRAHTVVYCAQTVPGGVLAQLRWEQAGRVQCSTALAPQCTSPTGCCRKHSSPPISTRKAAVFVAFADFVPVRLWQNMQLT